MQADASAHDAYRAPTGRPERIESDCGRYKRRLKDHAAGANGAVPEAMDIPSYVIQAPDHDEDTADGEFHPIVIAETKKAMKTLSVSEAVQDLDLTGAPLVTFRHAGSGRVNIVYRAAATGTSAGSTRRRSPATPSRHSHVPKLRPWPGSCTAKCTAQPTATNM